MKKLIKLCLSNRPLPLYERLMRVFIVSFIWIQNGSLIWDQELRSLLMGPSSLLAQPSDWEQAWEVWGRLPLWFWRLLPGEFWLIFLLLLSVAWGLLPVACGIFDVLFWMSYMGFWVQNPLMWYGADLVALFAITYAWLTHIHRDWALKIFGWHVLLIYFFTGIEKWKGDSWWQGWALWNVVGNPQMAWAWVSEVFQSVPLGVVLLTYLTIFWEIWFLPVLVWGRWPWNGVFWIVGLGFHLGIGLMLNLLPFSWVMWSCYPILWHYWIAPTIPQPGRFGSVRSRIFKFFHWGRMS